jgi:hypothetical protein
VNFDHRRVSVDDALFAIRNGGSSGELMPANIVTGDNAEDVAKSGIWQQFVARAGELSQADVSDMLRAAAVVGDDIQRSKAGAELAPETWTHGSSAERVHWVSVGKDAGLPAKGNTFVSA